MLDAQEIEAVLDGDRELRGFEVKGPGLRTDDTLFARVTRAALGMGNLRDGGHILIGINDKQIQAMLPGLTDDELASWLAFDDVARKMAAYAEPALRFEIAEVALSNGVRVAVIQVFEFFDSPHLCSKAFDRVLREGALYVRPRKMPETSEVASLVEMREVIQLATEKALRAFVETTERAGLVRGRRLSGRRFAR